MDAALTSLAGSPLLLVALFALVVGDAFLVILPGETAVVAVAALSASAGGPVPVPVLVVAALGAITGDTLLWLLGRRIGLDRWRWQRRPRPAAAIRRARAAILRRPALLIFTARYVPFARIAVNLVAGADGMPLRRFLALAVGAGIAWAAFNTVVGTVAGTLFQDQPLLAVAVSVLVAIALGLAVDGTAGAVGGRPATRRRPADPTLSTTDSPRELDLVDSVDMTTEFAVPPSIRIGSDSPGTADVQQLLHEHLSDMLASSPPESVHALSSAELARPGVTLWTARDESGTLLGCGALKDLGDGTGEIKSMRTAAAARGRGVGAAMLAHLPPPTEPSAPGGRAATGRRPLLSGRSRQKQSERVAEAGGAGGPADGLREFCGCSVDPLGQRLSRVVSAPPVVGRRVDAGGRDDGVQVRDKRADRVVEGERVPGCGADQDRLIGDRARLEHVGERREQAAVAGAEDRRDGDEAVGAGHRLDDVGEGGPPGTR